MIKLMEKEEGSKVKMSRLVRRSKLFFPSDSEKVSSSNTRPL